MTAVILVAVIAVQALTGTVTMRAILAPPIPWRMAAAIGTPFGMLVSLLGAQASVAMNQGSIGWLLSVVLAVAAVGARRLTGGSVSLLPSEEDSGALQNAWTTAVQWVPAAVVGALLQIPNWIKTPITNGYVSGDQYHPDVVFLEAVGQSVSLLGPNDSLLLADAPIRYHWFIYGWSGLITRISGIEPFWVLTRIVPVILVILAAWLAATWARQLSSVRWVPALAAWLVVVAGYVGADQGVMITFDSPSNGFATVLLLVFGLTVTLGIRSNSPLPHIILIGFWAFALTGAKASHAAVAGVGITVMAIALWFSRQRRSRAVSWSMVLATALGAGFGYLLLLSGISGSDSQIAVGGSVPHASTYQGLDPFSGTWGFLLGTAMLVLAMAPRWIGLVPLMRSSTGRQLPETWLALGMVTAGVVPLVLLTSGINAAWFALGASAPASVVSAVGIGSLRQRISLAPARRWAFILGVVLAGMVAWVLVLVNYGSAEITGAMVAWRSPIIAWIIAALGAVILMRFMRGSPFARFGFGLAIAISLISIFSRVAGPVLWNSIAAQTRPALERLVQLTDPSAEFLTQEYRGQARQMFGVGAGRAIGAGVSSARAALPDDVAYAAEHIQWSPTLQRAARELTAVAGPDDVIAMDYSILQPFLPTMVQRKVLLSGQPYIDGYTSAAAAATIPERFAAVQELRLSASPDAHRWLWEQGVRWIWLQFSPVPDAERIAGITTPLVINEEVAVLRLNDPDANSE